MKKQIRTEFIGEVVLQFESDIVDCEVLDTVVKIPFGGVICVIAGNTIDNFLAELHQVIEKYRI